MIDIRFKNSELLDLYSILIEFSDRFDNQNVLEIVHLALLDVLSKACPDELKQKINDEDVKSFQKWYNQQQKIIKEKELTLQDCLNDPETIQKAKVTLIMDSNLPTSIEQLSVLTDK
jgi:hypothetical protein